MEEKRIIFPAGMIWKEPKENAPEFIKGNISIKVAEFVEFLKEYENDGWVNLDLLKSKGGKLYLKLNEWKPKTETTVPQVNEPMTETTTNETITTNNIPF